MGSRVEIHVNDHTAGETTITSSSRESSLVDEEDGDLSPQESHDFTSSLADNDPRPRSPWDELDPSDSASASAEYHNERPRGGPARRHRYSQPRQHYRVPQAPAAMSSEPSEDYAYPYSGGHHPPYYGPPAQPSYPASHVGGPQYMPNRYSRQMVPYYQSNPFQSVGGPAPPGGPYYGDQRSPYEMMPYQNNYFANGHPYGLPPHMQQFMFHPPPPPPTEVGPSPPTPAPPAPAEKKLDPEVERMKLELETYKKDQERKAEAERQKLFEEKIRKDAEDAIHRRMEDMRLAQEEAKKEIEKAKADAERAAKERIEAERKADEERRKREAEATAAAEAAAKAKIEAAMRAEAEARALAELKAKEEEEWRKRLEEEAKLKAEIEARKKLEAEAQAKEDAERKAKEEADWRKKLEEEAKLKAEVEARAKIEAEKKAADEAKAAEEAKKTAEEAFKKQALEEAKAKAEEAVTKADKAPIKFKDAVGRKFSFPFHLCQTWPGMEELIKQAFLHVDVIGPHVQEGHYDLIGPNGEIILPSVWEKVIQPDWGVTMHMWPIEKTPPLRGHHPGMVGPGGIPLRGHHVGGGRIPTLPPGMRMPTRPGGGPIPAPPPGFLGRQFVPGGERGGAARVVTVGPEELKRERKKEKAGQSSVLGWMAGSGKSSKNGKKKSRP